MTKSLSSLIFTFSALYCSYTGPNFCASVWVTSTFAEMICFCADRRSFLSRLMSSSDRRRGELLYKCATQKRGTQYKSGDNIFPHLFVSSCESESRASFEE